jgi:hypothetical protein
MEMEKNTPCASTYTAGGGEKYTLNVCSSDGETPCSSTPAGAVDGYTLPVHTADDAKEYTPHVLNAGGGKGMQPAIPHGMRREGSLQLLHIKSMPLSMVHSSMPLSIKSGINYRPRSALLDIKIFFANFLLLGNLKGSEQ